MKIMIFISNVQYYIPIKLCRTAGNIHLFKIIGMLKPKNMKLNRNYIWDTPTVDTSTATSQLPVTKSAGTSIPETVYNLAQGTIF